MRYIFAILGLCLLAGTANAKPVSINEAMKELRDRGMKNVDGVTILGEPLITARLDEQTFHLKLTGCDSSEFRCVNATFSSCKDVASFSRLQSLELANTYNNLDDPRGAMFVDNRNQYATTVCIKKRRVLQEEDVFNMADVFEWQLTLRDFLEFVEAEETAKMVGAIMGASR